MGCTIARLLVDRVHGLQHREILLAPTASPIASGPSGSEAERHCPVEVFRRGDAHLHDVAADVDDVRHDALRDEAANP